MQPRFILSLILTLAATGSVASAANPPTLGAPAPSFRLQDESGQWRTLDDYRGQWLVLYFCPKDNSPGCTMQAGEFRDLTTAFRDSEATVLGVSMDEVATHRKFAEQQALPFTLLADPAKSAATAYDLVRGLTGAAGATQRDTFVIDPSGKLAKHYVRVDSKGHAQTVLNDLKALRKK